MILETERLQLHELDTGDASLILALLNEPAFIRNIADKNVRNHEDAVGYLRDGPLASYAAHGFGLYRVRLKHDNVPIGICGLIQRDTLDHPDLGYALLTRHSGRGYATEAAAAVLGHAYQQLDLARVLAVTAPDNRSSIRVLEKLGFRFEKMIVLGDKACASRLFIHDRCSRYS
ncbi:MAG: GNAT family N-acetyltransferase [Dyella sp.]